MLNPSGHSKCPTPSCQDYWSLGVTLHELLTGGQLPWGDAEEDYLLYCSCPSGVAEAISGLMASAPFSKGLQVIGRGFRRAFKWG